MDRPLHPAWHRVVVTAVGALLAPGAAQAASRLRVEAVAVEWQGIDAHEVALSMAPGMDSSLDFVLYAARVDGITGLGTVSNLRFGCRQAAVSARRIDCTAGRLSGRLGDAGDQRTSASLSLAADGRLGATLSTLALAGGTAALRFESRRDQWQAVAEFSSADPGQLAAMPGMAGRWLTGITLAGRADGVLEASGVGPALATLQLRSSLEGLSFADEAGAIAGEALGFEAEARITRRAASEDWRVESRLVAAAGQAYLQPVFLDFAVHPVRLDVTGTLAGDASALRLDHYRLEQQDVAVVEGWAELDLAGDGLLREARLELRDVALAGAVPAYVAPYLVGTAIADLQGLGRLRGEVGISSGLPDRVALEFEDVTLDSATGAIGVEGLSGRFSWFDERLRNELAPDSDSALFKSLLSWRSARLWGLEFGAASLPFTTTGKHFRLLEPALIPMFDGGLAIETLRVRHAGEPDMYLRFDAELKPISIGRLTRALGWPEFSGTIAGRIPRLELSDGLVTLGGNIEAQAFDGTVTVRNLRLRDPLGEFPRLYADIDVERLDLAQVTSTFEFGMITGRLSGRVEDLETFDWMPVAFDARFYSTPGDRSPRRIDQRAVSNLSSIGGGSGGSVTAALQGGFLRFFDSFRYDRLGLSCRLENDVCHMDGVERAANGYYIVKGAGLPRIDVIGSQRRVAWSRLVRQLAAILQSPGPVVE